MALTIVKKLPNGGPDAIGGYTWLNVADITFDNSYTTGGKSLTVADLGFPPNSSIIKLHAINKSGFLFEYDFTASKLKALTPLRKFTGTLDPASLATVTARDDTVTMTGLLTTHEVVGTRGPDALESKYIVKGGRVSGADTLTIRADNPSAASIDPASGTYTTYVANANMAGIEVASTTDLSALTVRVSAFAALIG